MSQLRSYLDDRRSEGRKILSIYLTAGFPDIAATPYLLKRIVDAGADLIELGVPFSDPMADGPTIQEASQIALDGGVTLRKAIDMLADFRRTSQTPILLMGYANPFYQFGWDEVIQASAKAGSNGFIIPDLPPEEAEVLQSRFNDAGLDLVHLVSPNTPAQRVEAVNQKTTGFIYAVSITGVTGARASLPESTVTFLRRLHDQTEHPVLVGFGISTPETAVRMSEFGDGIIIGSAIIKLILESANHEEAGDKVFKFVSDIRHALDQA